LNIAIENGQWIYRFKMVDLSIVLVIFQRLSEYPMKNGGSFHSFSIVMLEKNRKKHGKIHHFSWENHHFSSPHPTRHHQLPARHHQLPAGAPQPGPRPGRGPQRPGGGESQAALPVLAPGSVGRGKSEMEGNLDLEIS